MTIPLPEPRWLDTPDGRLAVVDEGQGTPVVLVHGTPSWSHEFRAVIAALGPHTRCVAVDHLGFGRSDKPPGARYDLAAHQARFAAAMDALEVDGAVLVLHDVGASIALPWAWAHPERVRGVVLANTFLWPADGPLSWVLRFYGTALGRWIYRWANLSARWLLPWAWGGRRPLTTEGHAAYLAPFPTPGDRHATAALPGELVGATLAGLAPRMAEVGRWPVRAVWGMADPLVGADALARWQEALPGLRVDTVADAGHFVADEAPEVVVAAIEALVEETGGWQHATKPSRRHAS